MFHITYRSSAGVSSVMSASATDRTIIEWIQELNRENKHITEITLDADEIGIIDRRLADLFRLNFADNHHLIDNLSGFGVLRGFAAGLLIRLVLLLESGAASIGRARDFQDGGQLQADLDGVLWIRDRQVWPAPGSQVEWINLEGTYYSGYFNGPDLNQFIPEKSGDINTIDEVIRWRPKPLEAVPGRQWINPNKYPFYVPMNGQAVEWVTLDGSAAAGNFDSKFTNHFIKFATEEGRPGEVVTKEQILKWRVL